jgi:hypothetical protein
MSGSLNPRIVEPGVKLGAPFTKAVRSVRFQDDQDLQHLARRRRRILTVISSVIETPDLRNESAQIGALCVPPATPVCGPSDFTIQGFHAGVIICVNNATTADDSI